MKKTNKFTPKDLDPAVLDQVLQSLSDYYISKRRLKVHETTLGKGGFGTVKLAELWPNVWIQFGGTPTTVAVKELRTENHDGVPLRTAARLAREIKVWASCNHENILEFTGYYLSKDFKKAYLVSPYMTNGNIKEYLSREAPSQEQRLEL
ncbi:hypothetical protein FRC04_002934 [Tulasnella sp. 424]|nr:hypothetical protein FRC04_002934 [Tulasnella sp. 424]